MADDNSPLHYFEGVEKLLEIWFKPNPLNKTADLREISRSLWESLLKTVRCEIISFSRNDNIDAYVLSESSMFVSKRRWILKTCGTTSPLQGLEQLLVMAENIGYNEIEDLFYSRKNFKRPELQIFPHGGFDEEVAFLDSIFEDGRAYCFGSVNRDCWYLYTLCRSGEKKLQKQFCNGNIIGRNGSMINNKQQLLQMEPDQTIEILMTDLNSEIMSIFSKDKCTKAIEATEQSGINKLIPGMIIDDYLFDPCGYSMNGIGKNISGEYPQGCYMTIHITPESEFSYCSFESNIAASNYNDLIHRVLNTFQPGKFIITIFANKSSPAFTVFRDMNRTEQFGNSWLRHDIQYCRFKNYDLTYAHYCKFPS